MKRLRKLSVLLATTASFAAAIFTSHMVEAKSSRFEKKFPSLSEDDIDDLYGSYVLVRTPASERIICQIAVRGNLQNFAVKPPYIAGSTSPLRGDGNSSKAGYFVLNTETSELKEGLTEEKWREELERIEWSKLQPAEQDYDEPLLGIYRLVRTNAYEVVIVHPDRASGRVMQEVFLHGNVRRLAIKQPFVVGYTTVSRGSLDREATAKAGFFVLNTESNELKEGLTENQWHDELKRIGWPEPILTRPP